MKLIELLNAHDFRKVNDEFHPEKNKENFYDSSIVRIYSTEEGNMWFEFGMYGWYEYNDQRIRSFIKEDILNLEVYGFRANYESQVLDIYLDTED